MGKRGRPLEAENSDDQCEAKTLMTEWKKAHKIGPRCPFVAKVQINGKSLCHKHASMEALATMIEKYGATVIFRPPRSPYEHVRMYTEPKKEADKT